MTETEKKYDAIRRAYPETISKDQFYRIAHISKATALHLLQNGLVPCKDTGKKTRRYTIRTDDVITHLIDNGKGMSDTDARLAFERHSTSKISKAEDLFFQQRWRIGLEHMESWQRVKLQLVG